MNALVSSLRLAGRGGMLASTAATRAALDPMRSRRCPGAASKSGSLRWLAMPATVEHRDGRLPSVYPPTLGIVAPSDSRSAPAPVHATVRPPLAGSTHPTTQHQADD